MRGSGIQLLIVIFLLGLLLGLLVTAALPDLDLTSVYEDWGLWGLVGRAAIAILLVGLPITYIAWLVSSSITAMRPQPPGHAMTAPTAPIIPRQMERVLVPVGGGTNVLLGLDLVNRMGDAGPTQITLMRVVPDSTDAEGVQEEERKLRQLAGQHLGPENDVEIRIVTGPSVADVIVEEARKGAYDLLVVGATRRPAVRTMLFGALPHALAEQVPCPLVVVHPGGGRLEVVG